MNPAARLYQDLDQFTSPVGAYQFADSSAALELDLGSRIDHVAVTSCTVTTGTEDDLRPGSDRARLVVHAPSVWHAVIHLVHENRNWLSGRYGGIHSPLIFRGQRDPAWSIVSSVNRGGVDREREDRRARCFAKLAFAAFRVNRSPWPSSEIVDALARFAPEPTREVDPLHVAWIATAQHYGVATPLLDFTLDPAVAAWFACRDAHEGQEVAIFALPTQWTKHAGVSVKLPHPLADRLFRQRGVFVETRLSPSDLRQLCIEVRFPADRSFRPLRRRYRDEIMPPEPWWQKVVDKAGEIADSKALDEFLRTPAEQLRLDRLLGSSRFAGPEEMKDRLVHSVRELTQMLVAFTIVIHRDDSFSPLRDGMRSFTRENGELLRHMLPMVRGYLQFADDGRTLRQVGLRMTEFLEGELSSPAPPEPSQSAGCAPGGQDWNEWAQGIVTIGGMHLLRDVTEDQLQPACQALRAAGAAVNVIREGGGVFSLLVSCRK